MLSFCVYIYDHDGYSWLAYLYLFIIVLHNVFLFNHNRFVTDYCNIHGSFFLLLGAGQNQGCNKAGAHTRDIPRYNGYVRGACLVRQTLRYHENAKSISFRAARQRATQGFVIACPRMRSGAGS